MSSPEGGASGEESWYARGLRFSCTRCGNCCTGSGTVRVDDDEQQAIASQLGITSSTFRQNYLHRLPDGKYSLKEKPNTDCIFFVRGQGCSIYELRPRQCRTWPFWRGNLASRRHWHLAAEGCPGMNQGELHSLEEIDRSATRDGTSGIVPELHP